MQRICQSSKPAEFIIFGYLLMCLGSSVLIYFSEPVGVIAGTFLFASLVLLLSTH